MIMTFLNHKLTIDVARTAQVDAGQPTCQPSWFLSARFWRQDPYFDTDRGGRHLPGGCEYMLGSPLYDMRTRRSCRHMCEANTARITGVLGNWGICTMIALYYNVTYNSHFFV